MKTVTVRAIGSVVFFLSTDGFKKGEIKNVNIRGSKNEVQYFVTCPSFTKEYMGDTKTEDELFDSQQELIAHYAEVKL